MRREAAIFKIVGGHGQVVVGGGELLVDLGVDGGDEVWVDHGWLFVIGYLLIAIRSGITLGLEFWRGAGGGRVCGRGWSGRV